MGRSGFWIRFAATAIDVVLYLIIVVIVVLTMWGLDLPRTWSPAMLRMLEALPLALYLAYTSMEVVIGATLGKLATGIVIALPDGAPAPPWTRFLRWLTKQSGMFLYLLFSLTEYPVHIIGGMINLALAFGLLRMLDEDKRAWHDYWCHTAVVPRKRAAALRDLHEEPVGPPPPT